MPMTFDTYSVCSYNCLYCFSFFQKSHSSKGYLKREVNAVNIDRIKNMYLNALSSNPEDTKNSSKQFIPYIRNRVTLQWGGLADGFDEYERQYGLSLELLKFFDKIDYPLSISTKGTWWTQDNRYMDIIKKHSHNWHFKISIITANELKAKAIERGVDSPQKRLNAISRLADNGLHVTLRLRPYIIGVSDDYHKLIPLAKNAGADSVTTEFFCVEGRANERLKSKYTEIGKYAGYDILDFYKKNSNQSGYYRLNYSIKRKIINEMKDISHSLGMRFYVSDAHHKEKSDYCSCCGTPPHMKVSKGHFAEALQIAKKRKDGLVYWKDIEPDLKKYVSHIPFYGAEGFNTKSNKVRAIRADQNLMTYVKEFWNTPKSQKSPYGYFEGVLYPIGLDKDKNVIYKLNRQKAGL